MSPFLSRRTQVRRSSANIGRPTIVPRSTVLLFIINNLRRLDERAECGDATTNWRRQRRRLASKARARAAAAGAGQRDEKLHRNRLKTADRAEKRRPRSRASRRRRAIPSVAEVPHPGERHGDPGRIGGGDHLGVAQRAAGLDDRRRARLDRRHEAVGEGEEGVRGDDRALACARPAGRRRAPRQPPCARRSRPSRRATSVRRRRRPSAHRAHRRSRST